MIITKETDYALRILSALSDGEKTTTEAICKKELIPMQFGYKIIKKLDVGGFVHVIRGKAGGCQLATDLNQRTLYDLMIAVEESTEIISCMKKEYLCNRRDMLDSDCTIHTNLARIQSVLDQELKKNTIANIIKNN